jgi:protein-S-isoprenylcysteine O-methyltransferase Ste14
MRSKAIGRLRKIFGVGPAGAAISLLLLAVFAWMNARLGPLAISTHAAAIKALGGLLVALGLGLHFWAFSTLRSWWANDELCTTGPFAYFRHPMYAAWITFIASGTALWLNSWIYLLWVMLLQALWHRIVKKEENSMKDTFGETYRRYARRTGRFVPVLRRRKR